MYLLKPVSVYDSYKTIYEFTFHYVSIKTKIQYGRLLYLTKFTFHYVSIKTGDENLFADCLEYIYIPLCIY